VLAEEAEEPRGVLAQEFLLGRNGLGEGLAAKLDVVRALTEATEVERHAEEIAPGLHVSDLRVSQPAQVKNARKRNAIKQDIVEFRRLI